MTTPVPPKPSSLKTVVALIGSLLSFVIPLLLQVSQLLPPPWPAVIGGVVALLTALGVYHAPYKPTGTVLVPTAEAPPAADTNPYK